MFSAHNTITLSPKQWFVLLVLCFSPIHFCIYLYKENSLKNVSSGLVYRQERYFKITSKSTNISQFDKIKVIKGDGNFGNLGSVYKYSNISQQDNGKRTNVSDRTPQFENIQSTNGEENVGKYKNISISGKTYKIKDKNTFLTLEGEPYLIIRSAFLDYRFKQPQVQVLTIMGKTVRRNAIVCHFLYNKSSVQITRNVESVAVELNAFMACFFKDVIIRCSFLREYAPDYVSVSMNNTEPSVWIEPKTIENSVNLTQPKNTFGVCLKPLYNLQNDHLPNMVTFLEMQRILGAEQVIMYDIWNSSTLYRYLFGYYDDTGFVKVVPWDHNIPGRSSQHKQDNVSFILRKLRDGRTVKLCVGLYSQLLALQDCILSSMDRFSHVVVVDSDEFIIPRQGYTYSDVIELLNKGEDDRVKFHSYSFSEAHFCPDLEQKIGIHFGTLLRLDPIIPVHTKTIVVSQLMDRIRVHGVSHMRDGAHVGARMKVPASVGNVHHYRRNSYCANMYNPHAPMYMKEQWLNTTIIRDTTALKYFPDLLKRLKAVANDVDVFLPGDVMKLFDDAISDLERRMVT